MSIYDTIDERRPDTSGWTLPEFPLIASAGIREIEMDHETDGLDWFNRDILIGTAVCLPDGSTRYLPIRHRVGANLPVERYDEWAKTELRDVHIVNVNTRFDIHVSHKHGIDLEAQGCTASDILHYAALLDDHRQKNNQELLCREFLQDEEKVKAVFGETLNVSRMADYPAGMVAVRAEADVRQVHKLKQVMLPMLAAQDLMRVKELEDQVIWVVCEMERNGSPLDLELLDKWLVQSEAQLIAVNKEIAALLGRSHQIDLFEGGKADTGFLNPDAPKEMEALFKLLGLPIARTKTGRPSFTAHILKAIDHPVIKMIRQASRLKDLRSKYLVSDRMRIGSDGIMRYALHQLRTTKDEFGEKGEAGTISGRFSSTEILDSIGVNIQQRIKVSKQRVQWGYDENDTSHDDEIYLIRRLHIPGTPGAPWLSADAKQIEYRIFASYANNPKILEAYRQNPDMSFHKFMHDLIRPFKPDQTYRQQKDLNFAKIYGAGTKKLALMLGFITAEQWAELTETKAKRTHPLLREAAKVEDIYNQLLPEVAPLLRRASHLAMEECDDYCKNGKWDEERKRYRALDELHRKYPHNGFVRTVFGRRSRFPGNYRVHKAFNAVDQGSAADAMKLKLVELHKARKYTNFLMRFTVHDEADGDAREGIETAKRVREVLDAQSIPEFKVKILWDVSLGKNWAECGEDSASLDKILEREAIACK